MFSVDSPLIPLFVHPGCTPNGKSERHALICVLFDQRLSKTCSWKDHGLEAKNVFRFFSPGVQGGVGRLWFQKCLEFEGPWPKKLRQVRSGRRSGVHPPRTGRRCQRVDVADRGALRCPTPCLRVSSKVTRSSLSSPGHPSHRRTTECSFACRKTSNERSVGPSSPLTIRDPCLYSAFSRGTTAWETTIRGTTTQETSKNLRAMRDWHATTLESILLLKAYYS